MDARMVPASSAVVRSGTLTSGSADGASAELSHLIEAANRVCVGSENRSDLVVLRRGRAGYGRKMDTDTRIHVTKSARERSTTN